MPNVKGKYKTNIKSLIDTLIEAYNNGNLFEDANHIFLTNEEDTLLVGLNKEDGSFINSRSGADKSNRRSYVSLNIYDEDTDEYRSYMLNNYLFYVVARAILDDDTDTLNNLLSGWEINHINGDSLDNRLLNLEVVPGYLNKAHSRLMYEINNYFPDAVEIIGTDCNGNRMHRFCGTMSEGISCKEIQEYNKCTKDDKIKAYKGSENHFSEKELEKIICRITLGSRVYNFKYGIKHNGWFTPKPLKYRLKYLEN